MLKYQPSIFENESNNICNASTYFNQYEHGNSAPFDKFDLGITRVSFSDPVDVIP